MCWLNTQEVRGILDLDQDLEVVSTDQAQAPRDPLQWAQAEEPSRGMCTKCGDEGRKQWHTRMYGAEQQRWCPGCIAYHENNMTESAVHTSEEQPMVVRLLAAAENGILRECTA